MSYNRGTKNYAKIKLEEKLKGNFQKIYKEQINEDSKKKLFDLIFNDLNFIDLYEIDEEYKYELKNKIDDKVNKEINKIKINNDIIDYLMENINNKEMIDFFELDA